MRDQLVVQQQHVATLPRKEGRFRPVPAQHTASSAKLSAMVKFIDIGKVAVNPVAVTA